MGQYRKSTQQIQTELDEIHRLWSTGATDEHIMKTRKIKRAQFFKYKRKLCTQLADVWAKKRDEDYQAEVQLCKERLTNDRVRAELMSTQTRNPLWGQLAAELAVSILKLEFEGITSLKNARLKRLEEKAGYIELKPTGTEVSAAESDGLAATNNKQTTNDERQF